MPVSFMKFLVRIKPWGCYWEPIIGSISRHDRIEATLPWEWRTEFIWDEWGVEREDTRYENSIWSIVPRL